MKSTPSDIANHLEALQESPVLFRDLTGRLTGSETYGKDEPKVWTLVEIVCHLSASAEIWGDNIETVVSEESPIISTPHPNTVMTFRLSTGKSFAELSDEFGAMRGRLITRPNPIIAAQWGRSSMINEQHHTVYTLTRRTALHEVTHVGKICEMLATLMVRDQ